MNLVAYGGTARAHDVRSTLGTSFLYTCAFTLDINRIDVMLVFVLLEIFKYLFRHHSQNEESI